MESDGQLPSSTTPSNSRLVGEVLDEDLSPSSDSDGTIMALMENKRSIAALVVDLRSLLNDLPSLASSLLQTVKYRDDIGNLKSPSSSATSTQTTSATQRAHRMVSEVYSEVQDNLRKIANIQRAALELARQSASLVQTCDAEARDVHCLNLLKAKRLDTYTAEVDLPRRLDVLYKWFSAVVGGTMSILGELRSAHQLSVDGGTCKFLHTVGGAQYNEEPFHHELTSLTGLLSGLLCSVIQRSLVVNEEPQQVLRRETKFSLTVSFWFEHYMPTTSTASVGNLGSAGVFTKMPSVRVEILNETLMGKVQTQGVEVIGHGLVGEVSNGHRVMDQCTDKVTAQFKDLKIKKALRKNGQRNGHSVLEEKFCLAFIVDLTGCLHPLIQWNGASVFVMSWPVIYTKAGNQDVQSYGTMLWDNGFASIPRNTFNAPDQVEWTALARVLSSWFRKKAGKGLTERHLRYLATKLTGQTNVTGASELMVKRSEFYLKSSGSEFTFWEWFYTAQKLITDHLEGYWTSGIIEGFISKQEANDLLLKCNPGTFLIRFSETSLGSVVIPVLSPNGVIRFNGPVHKSEFSRGITLSRTILLQSPMFQFLYPDQPKTLVKWPDVTSDNGEEEETEDGSFKYDAFGFFLSPRQSVLSPPPETDGTPNPPVTVHPPSPKTSPSQPLHSENTTNHHSSTRLQLLLDPTAQYIQPAGVTSSVQPKEVVCSCRCSSVHAANLENSVPAVQPVGVMRPALSLGGFHTSQSPMMSPSTQISGVSPPVPHTRMALPHQIMLSQTSAGIQSPAVPIATGSISTAIQTSVGYQIQPGSPSATLGLHVSNPPSQGHTSTLNQGFPSSVAGFNHNISTCQRLAVPFNQGYHFHSNQGYDQGQSAQGQSVQGQNIQGQSVQGQNIQGQSFQGQTFRGQRTQGQSVHGLSIQGQSIQVQSIPDHNNQSQIFQGQSVQGQNIQGQGVQCQSVQGQSILGENAQSQNIQGQSIQGQSIQGQSIQGQSIQGQIFQGQSIQGQNNQGQIFQGQSIQGQSFQGQSFQGQSFQGQSFQGQSDQGQSDQGQSIPGQSVYMGLPYNSTEPNRGTLPGINTLQHQYAQSVLQHSYSAEYDPFTVPSFKDDQAYPNLTPSEALSSVGSVSSTGSAGFHSGSSFGSPGVSPGGSVSPVISLLSPSYAYPEVNSSLHSLNENGLLGLIPACLNTEDTSSELQQLQREYEPPIQLEASADEDVMDLT